ncbi:MAG: hypothetical protein HKP42_00480 [Maribacter sp.]|nr:hypothetical protein [Maribacter sp.]
MELLDHTTEWVKGEVFQGKIMLAIGILLLIGGVAILKSDHEILKGTLIPLGLILLLILGYGAMQVFSRPGHVTKVSQVLAENPQDALEQEYNKAMKDDKIYSTLKIVWSILIVIAAGLYLLFPSSSHYLKGLAIGLIGLFLTVLVVDSVLHYRLSIYLKAINGLM